MSGKTSPAHITLSARCFYSESPPKRTRLHESNSQHIRPAFKSLKDNLIKFDKKLSEPITKSLELKEPIDQRDIGEEPKSLDRDSPLPLKNLGNTCYENSIIQCLFSLNLFMDNFERSMTKMRELVVKPKMFDTNDKTVVVVGQKCQLDSLSAATTAGPNPSDADSCNSSISSDSSGISTISINSSSSFGLCGANTTTTASTTDTTTISEKDVRYRIADAFDKLYKSYTQKRIQIETNNQNSASNKTNQSSASTHQSHQTNQLNNQLENAKTDFRSDYTVSQPSIAAIPLCKSNHAERSTTANSRSNTGDSIAPETTSPATSTQTGFNDNQKSSINTADTLASANLTPIALVSSATTTNEQSEIETRLEDLKSAVGERSSQFNSTHQQDASEFFYHVIDSIQEFYQSLNKTKDDENPVTKAFELELDYLIRCPKCHHKTMTESEKIRTLPLALPHVNNEASTDQEEYNHETDHGAPTPPTSDLGSDSPGSSSSEQHRNGSDEKENQALVVDEIVSQDNSSPTPMSIAKLDLTDKTEVNILSNSPQKHYTLCDALNNYFKDDLLEYSCSQAGCDSKQRTKKCLIRKLPQVLFITLARYSYTGKKNLDEVEAPFELSVPFRENKSPSHSPSAHHDFDEDDNKYQLVAVVCHLGSSLNAGHYTSYVYNQNNLSWYSCDDDSITKVQESEVKGDATKSGYCFFYAHKGKSSQNDEQFSPENPS